MIFTVEMRRDGIRVHARYERRPRRQITLDEIVNLSERQPSLIRL